MEQRLDTTWRKSTYSGGSGTDCVEVTDTVGRVLVRDTKDRDGATLSVPATEWRTFTARLKRTQKADPTTRQHSSQGPALPGGAMDI